MRLAPRAWLLPLALVACNSDDGSGTTVVTFNGPQGEAGAAGAAGAQGGALPARGPGPPAWTPTDVAGRRPAGARPWPRLSYAGRVRSAPLLVWCAAALAWLACAPAPPPAPRAAAPLASQAEAVRALSREP